MADITMAPAPVSLRVGQVLSQALALLLGDFGKFFLLTAITWSPYLIFLLLGVGAARGGIGAAQGNAAVAGLGVTALLWGVLSILGQAAVLYGAIQKMRGQEFGVGASLSRGLARFFPIIGMLICLGVAVGFGMVLLLVPGIILAMMWYVALPACVVETLGPIESLSRSAFLTKGNRWRLFGIAIVVYIINSIVQLAVQSLSLAVAGPIVSAVVVFAWLALFHAYNAIVVAVAYHDLRVIREGADIEQIAAVFD